MSSMLTKRGTIPGRCPESIARICGSVLACQLIIFSFAVAAVAGSPAKTSRYSESPQFDIRRIPFSRYGSYLSFRREVSNGKPGSLEGVFLRTVHGKVPQQELFQLRVMDEDRDVPFEAIATPTLLTLKAASGEIEIFLPTAERIRFRIHGVSLRFERPGGAATSENSFATWAEPVDQAGDSARVWDYTASPQDLTLRLTSTRGNLRVENTWNGQASDKVSFTFSPGQQGYAEASIEEFAGTYHAGGSDNNIASYIDTAKRAVAHRTSEAGNEKKSNASLTFDQDLAGLRSEYAQWISRLPAVPENMQATADLAAYLNWSSVVEPQGFLTRPTMLMSKVSMTAVWSWDHCFNAMALASAHPELAWDQFMWVFDSENYDGISPDLQTDRSLLWSFSKPPVHGLTMAYLEKENPAFFSDPARLRELYPKLVRRTEWYFRYRDWDGDGLPQYNHGNDSGWDNSSVFRTLPPAETPDLAAFLVLQMEELAHIASEINKPAESKVWEERANQLRGKLLDKFWREGRFVALHEGDHRVIDSDSLILYMPIMLGAELPEGVRKELISKLKKPRHFLTDHGLATEPLASPNYIEDGYWRGPIWAPSTFLIVEGVDAAGDHEFANDLRRRFCDLVMKGGFAENFGARTGAALRDPAYTWTASVFLMFAQELESGQQSGNGAKSVHR